MDYWDRLCKQPVFFLCGKNVMEHSQKVCYNVANGEEMRDEVSRTSARMLL